MLKAGPKKIFLFVVLFYFLALFQYSFLSHFAIKGVAPNLVLIAVLALGFFKRKESVLKGAEGFAAGFFLDIFSSFPLGTAALSLGLTTVISRRILRNFKKINCLSALLLFVLATLLFEFLAPLFGFLFKIPSEGITSLIFPLNYGLLLALIYNSVLGLLVFYFVKIFRK